MVLNIETKQQLEKLLAKPGSATQSDIPFLQQLIKTFPYYQPLHLLLAKASSGNDEQQHSAFTKAALYTNGGILHRIIHEPQQLNSVEEINVVTYKPWGNIRFAVVEDKQVEDIVSAAEPIPSFTDNAPEIENLEPLANEIIAIDDNSADAETTTEEIKEAVVPEKATDDFILPEIENLEPLANEVIAIENIQEDFVEELEAAQPAVQTANDNFILPEIENLEPLQSEIIKICEPEVVVDETENQQETDEQETFEEITEFVAPIEINVVPNAEALEVIDEQTETTEVEITEELTYKEETEQELPSIEEVEEETVSEVEKPTDEPEPELTELEEELEIETLASSDFFAFDRNFSTEAAIEEEEEADAVIEEPKVVEEPIFSPHVADENIVSKYDDDKLPFTFLWWLAKTRKDHEQIFRPFASPVKANAQPLQQQYVEHIFHIQAPLELGEEEQIVALAQQTKGNEIIDNFIKNDPQIKALKPDQINNENKAKRSAEDSNDVVSETLAQIYIEQMLYHKAIDTYQKLSLKFPEKSGYFADLIQSLEKKI